jgi:hypothetical protein
MLSLLVARLARRWLVKKVAPNREGRNRFNPISDSVQKSFRKKRAGRAAGRKRYLQAQFLNNQTRGARNSFDAR